MRALACLPAAALLLAGASAQADTMPHRKAGLWEVHMNSQDQRMPQSTMQFCIDASTDGQMMNMGARRAQENCTKPTPHNSGNVTTMDFQCTMAGHRQNTHIVFTRQGDDAYTMEMHSEMVPPMRGMGQHTMVETAKWMGPCKAGMQPGDMIMPGGMKMNVLNPHPTMPGQ